MDLNDISPNLVLVMPCAVFVCAFVSGAIGVVGGSLLMLILASFLPIPLAFILHGAAQSSSNMVRGALFYKHAPWKSIWRFYLGSVFSVSLLSLIAWLPSRSTLFLMLAGATLFALFVPKSFAPDFARPRFAFLAGVLVGVPTLIVGVSAGVLDSFFLKSELNRCEVMAAKSLGMLVMHFAKIVYAASFLVLPYEAYQQLFTLIPSIAFSSLAGTLLGKSVLLRMSEAQFRQACFVALSIATIASLLKGAEGYL